MSEEKVEVMRTWLWAFENDTDAFRDTIHPEIEWFPFEEGHTPSHSVEGAEFFAPDSIFDLGELPEVAGSGSSEIRFDEFLEWRAGWIDPYDEWSWGVERILDAGANKVVATLHQRGKLRGTDDWIEMRYGIVYTVEDGVVMRGKVYATPEGAFEAAGLSEQA